MDKVEIEFSTETVLDNLTELKNTDPSIMQEFLKDFGRSALSFSLQLVIAIVIFLVGGRIIALIRRIVRKTLEKREADPGVRQFLDSLIKAICYVLLVFLILALFGVTTASIVAILGSAGLAIGLALQGSLSNLAGGVLILLLKPFRVGDYIMEDKHKNEGVVEEITIFYTTLRTVDNRSVVIPNGDLANSSVVNFTRSPERKLIYTVGIAYDADLKKAKEILRDVLEKTENRDREREIMVYVDSLGDSSVNLGFRIWLPTEQYWLMRWDIIERIKLAFDENGIEIPYQKIDIAMKTAVLSKDESMKEESH